MRERPSRCYVLKIMSLQWMFSCLDISFDKNRNKEAEKFSLFKDYEITKNLHFLVICFNVIFLLWYNGIKKEFGNSIVKYSTIHLRNYCEKLKSKLMKINWYILNSLIKMNIIHQNHLFVDVFFHFNMQIFLFTYSLIYTWMKILRLFRFHSFIRQLHLNVGEWMHE